MLGLVLTVGVLFWGKPVIVPLALAVLLTFVLAPIVSLVQGWGLGRVPAVLVTVVLAFTALGGIGWGVGVQVNKLAQELPENKEKIQKKIADLRGSGDGAFAKLLGMIREISEDPGHTQESPAEPKPVVVARPEQPFDLERLAHTVGPVLEPLAVAGLVVVLVVFMLISARICETALSACWGTAISRAPPV